jgi:hypothetical protein
MLIDRRTVPVIITTDHGVPHESKESKLFRFESKEIGCAIDLGRRSS